MLLKIITNPVLAILLAFSLSSCELLGDLEGSEVVKMRVNHYQATAFGVGPQLVYLVQEAEEIGAENWSFFYDQIQGFDFEPGFIYDLRVRKLTLADPPADASRFQYILVKIKSKEKVSETEVFDVKLKWAGNNFITTRETKMYLNDQYQIDCADMCSNLQEQLETSEEVTATFSHGENGMLLLHSLR